MMLVADIGNTSINIGIYDGECLSANWNVQSSIQRLPDEYAALLLELMGQRGLAASDITEMAVCSVVPTLTQTFVELSTRYFKAEALVVAAGVKTGVRIRMDNPREVGADRIANAAAAHHLYRRAVIVVDMGTATTFDVISREGDYLGGAIAPGIAIAAESMFYKTAMLPRIEFSQAKKAIGTDTISAMQSGLLFGYVGLVEGLVARIKAEMSEPPLVVATGGYARLMMSHTKVIDEINPELTLTGIRLIYSMNRT
jgi:type III pantothenate kinase